MPDNNSDKYVNNVGTYIDTHVDRRGKDHIDFYDRDPREENHNSIHINWDGNEGKGTITRTNDGEKTQTDVGCYITTACMRHYKANFDDNCYELKLLRWFRDNFVLEDDVNIYYKMAPFIVETIDEDENANIIYEDIYNNVIAYCVKKIENGEYEAAYDRYKTCIINLDECYVRPKLHGKLVKSLKKSLVK